MKLFIVLAVCAGMFFVMFVLTWLLVKTLPPQFRVVLGLIPAAATGFALATVFGPWWAVFLIALSYAAHEAQMEIVARVVEAQRNEEILVEAYSVRTVVED